LRYRPRAHFQEVKRENANQRRDPFNSPDPGFVFYRILSYIMSMTNNNYLKKRGEQGTISTKILAIIVAGIVVIVIGIYTVHRVTEIAPQTLDKTGEMLTKIASAFKTGTVTIEFHDYVTKVSGVNYLQIANLKSVDTFTRTDSTAIFWNLIGLPDVTVEIQAPVEYTFYLDLNDKWDFIWNPELQSVFIVAPSIKCNTPAVDIANLKMMVKDGSIFRDASIAMEKLKREMPELARTVASEKILMIREIARRETRNFAENWIVKIMFKDSVIKPHVQEVYFVDETLPEILRTTSIEEPK